MSDTVIINGDLANYVPLFGAAIVMVRPGTMKGSGPATVGGKPICVKGDESSAEVPGCMYTAPPYVIPGVGTVKISALAANQVAKKTKTGGTAMILRGSMFEAVFEVQSPAQQPQITGPVPDATPKYSGKGTFISTNLKHTAT